MEVFFHLDRFSGGVSCNARIYHAENHCDMGKYEESGEKDHGNSRCEIWEDGGCVYPRAKFAIWSEGNDHGGNKVSDD